MLKVPLGSLTVPRCFKDTVVTHVPGITHCRTDEEAVDDKRKIVLNRLAGQAIGLAIRVSRLPQFRRSFGAVIAQLLSERSSTSGSNSQKQPSVAGHRGRRPKRPGRERVR